VGGVSVATKKSTTDKTARRQLAANISKLRKKGLVTKAGELSPKYARSLVKKFADVLANRAHVVTIKDAEMRREYRQTFAGAAEKVVVPKSKSAKRARYVKSAQAVRSYASFGEGSFQMEIGPGKRSSIKDIPEAPKGSSYLLPMRTNHGRIHVLSFATRDDLLAFVNEYSRKPNQFKDAMDYVMIGRKTRRRKKELDDDGEE